MKHFSAWNFNKRRRLIALIIIALILALLLFIKPVNVLQIFGGANDMVMTKGDTKEKNIALTFNISWGDEKVYDILSVLKEHETEATFFLSGEWAERHPQIVEKIQEDKHEIGMLGYRYKNYEDQDLEQIKKDIMYAKEVFKKMEIDSTFIRPPDGVFNKETVELAESMGLKVIHWSVDPHDWENPSKEALITTLQEQVGNGDIILLHASDAVKQTADALQTVLPVFRDKHLNCVTISTLIDGVSVKEKLIE